MKCSFTANKKRGEYGDSTALLLTLKCVYNYCVQICVFYASIPFPSIYNQSIPIYLSIDIDNRYQSITTRIFAIDWSSIININGLIDIDWY